MKNNINRKIQEMHAQKEYTWVGGRRCFLNTYWRQLWSPEETAISLHLVGLPMPQNCTKMLPWTTSSFCHETRSESQSHFGPQRGPQAPQTLWRASNTPSKHFKSPFPIVAAQTREHCHHEDGRTPRTFLAGAFQHPHFGNFCPMINLPAVSDI